jgi:hypothetical protein
VLTIAETSLSIYTCIIESTVAWAMVVYGNLYGYSTYFEGNAVAIFGNYTYIVLGSTAVEGCVCKGTGSSYGALYMAYNSFIAFFWSVVDNQAAASYGIELIGLCYGYIYASGFTTGTPTGLYCAMGSTALEYSCTNNATIPRSPAAASDPSYISVV